MQDNGQSTDISQSVIAAVQRSLFRDQEPPPLVAKIIIALTIDIIEGRMPPGYELPAQQLARRFGVSRAPVREALLALARDGAIEINARKRPKVAAVTLEHAREDFEVRSKLYELVSELVVNRASDAQLEELRAWTEILHQDVDSGDVNAYFWHNRGFRQSEAALTGNRRLQDMLESLGLRTYRISRLNLSLRGNIGKAVVEQESLLSAYLERDVKLATAINSRMLENSYRAVQEAGGLTPGAVEALARSMLR